MNLNETLLRAGIELSDDSYEPWHGALCSCSKCVAARMDAPALGQNDFALQLKLEATNRKCTRKRCKREGCSCW